MNKSGIGLLVSSTAITSLLSGISQPGKMVSPLPEGYVYVTPTPRPTEAPQAQKPRTEDSTTTARTPGGGTTARQLEIEKKIREAFRVYGTEVQEEAVSVAYCENRELANVCNDGLNRDGSIDCGVFQINITVHRLSREDMLNPDKNIKQARKMYQRRGWKDWSSSEDCWNK